MRPTHIGLALVALGLGATAALSDRERPANGRIDVAELSRLVAREDDHVTAVELATWIRARKPRLRVLDLRSASEFDSLHIPGAERIAIDSLATIRLSPAETVVLYSEGGAHSAQAWVFLRALGLNDVYFLRGGVHEWLNDVLFPGLPLDATDAERASFARASELSRYFGGAPRRGVTREEKTTQVIQARRRGC